MDNERCKKTGTVLLQAAGNDQVLVEHWYVISVSVINCVVQQSR